MFYNQKIEKGKKIIGDKDYFNGKKLSTLLSQDYHDN